MDPSIEAELNALDARIKAQNVQIRLIQSHESDYERNGDKQALIAFWENIWNNGGLLFNGSKWHFRLPDLYISEKRYDDALAILERLRKTEYKEKAESYIEKVKQKQAKSKRT